MLPMSRVRKAFEEIDSAERAFMCKPEAIEIKTFAEILSGIFLKEQGIYIIWGCSTAERPLYVGKTTRGFFRALDHWNRRSKSPICEIIRQSAPDSLNWKVFFCPVLNRRSCFCPDGALLSFERKIAKRFEPWFWHYGFRNGDHAPWYIVEWLDLP